MGMKVRFKDIMGYSKEELTSRPFIEFIHSEDREMVFERYAKRLKGEKIPTGYSFRVITRDGITKWVEINAVAAPWEGKPATLNFLGDITERKRAAEALKESEEGYRGILENILDVYYRSDREGSLIMLSPSGLALLGYDSEDNLIGKSISDAFYFNPEDRNSVCLQMVSDKLGLKLREVFSTYITFS